MQLNKLFLAFFYSILLAYSGFALAQITILQTHRPDAGELVPIIQSQLSQGSSVQVYQNQLILNASASETAKIKRLLEQLDGKARQLFISVKTEQDQSRKAQSLHHYQNSAEQGFGQQAIRATEGYPSFISIGHSRLINTGENSGIWQQAATGFYATAYIYQGQVRINIEQQQASLEHGKQIQQQQLISQVEGSLGQWIKIGAINSAQRQQNLLHAEQNNSTQTLYLKVDLAK